MMREAQNLNTALHPALWQTCVMGCRSFKIMLWEGFVKPIIIMTENLNFGQAIEALKQGKRVARQGWNGKGMYLTLVQGYPVNGHLNADSVDSEVEGETQGNAGQMLSHIVMKTAGDSQYWGAGYSDYVPWLASQTDILSEDWVIL